MKYKLLRHLPPALYKIIKKHLKGMDWRKRAEYYRKLEVEITRREGTPLPKTFTIGER